MTINEKNRATFGEIFEVSVIKKDEATQEEFLESESVKIKPIRQRDFLDAMQIYNKNDIAGFILLCTTERTREWLENELSPESLMGLYARCLEVNENGFFQFIKIARERELSEVQRYNAIADSVSPDRLEAMTKLAMSNQSQNK